MRYLYVAFYYALQSGGAVFGVIFALYVINEFGMLDFLIKVFNQILAPILEQILGALTELVRRRGEGT